MKIKHFYDKNTSTYTYIIIDLGTNKCAIIDPVLDYNIYTGKVTTHNADKIIKYIKTSRLSCQWVLDTHIHADHITAAYYLKFKLNCKVGIGSEVKKILKYWVPIFNMHNEVSLNGSQFDQLFKNNEEIKIGGLKIKVLFTPGHTAACVSYYVKNNIFVGDTLFMPEAGTARTDFPGGSASDLYDSIKKILSLPKNTKIYICHHYPENIGEEQFLSTVELQDKNNILINNKISKDEFIKLRNERDNGKLPPKFLYPSIQTNIKSGELYTMQNNEKSYIKIPVSFNRMK